MPRSVRRGEPCNKVEFAFYYIPEGLPKRFCRTGSPRCLFYTNNSLLIAGSLIYRDLRTMSVLANASVGLQTLQAKGMDERTAMAFLQPIVIDTHALSNPWLNYSVYLNNTILPGILMMMIFMVTVFCHRERNQGGYGERVVGHGGTIGCGMPL